MPQINLELMGCENRRCITKFPELLDSFPADELSEKAQFGSYPFHEDIFNEFVQMNRHSKELLKRVGEYIEELMDSSNRDDVNLAEIGLLEGLFDRNVFEIKDFLGVKSEAYVVSRIRVAEGN